MPDPSTLYLIDGHAQIFRAYHAIRGGMNSPVTGEATQASFGVTGMLLKLFREFHPTYVVMAVDTEGPTFRAAIDPEYKANREAPPEDFAPQVERICQITRMFGVPVIGIPEAEADDVIATLTDRLLADEPALHIRIVSRDKDLQQLLGPRVSLFDIHRDEAIDVAALREKLGLEPEQIADALALAGDSSDNIPGVPGIGMKTAAKLLAEHGSLEAILADPERIGGKRGAQIRRTAERLEVNRRLVALKRDLPIDFSLEDARVGAIDAEGLHHAFRELGFNRHREALRRLLPDGPDDGTAPGDEGTPPDAGNSGAGATFPTSLFDGGHGAAAEGLGGVIETPAGGLTTTGAGDYRAITTAEALEALVTRLREAPRVAIDTETIGLGPKAPLCGICLAAEPGTGYYVPVRSPEPARHLDLQAALEGLAPLLEDAQVAKVGHHLKYDLRVLHHAGAQVAGALWDTMIEAWMSGEPGLGLDDLALALLGHQATPISDLIGPRGREQKTMDQVPLEQATPYSAEDADLTLRLHEHLQAKLEAMGLIGVAAGVEMPLVAILTDMERRGIRVDPGVLAEQDAELSARIDALSDQIHALAGRPFNLDSPRQLATVLFEELGFPVGRRNKTGPSTDSSVLEKLRDTRPVDGPAGELPGLLLEYRQLTKLISTYLKALGAAIDPATGRVHARFHQTATATGRLSSSDPNLQNIPVRTDLGRRIRRAFVAEPGGRLLCADYSQVELRMLAHLSEDTGLIEAFEGGRDIHATVASEVFEVPPEKLTPELRTGAKTINFGIIYGVTPWGLASRVEHLDVEGARDLIARYKARFPGIDRFLATCIEAAERDGYVRTILGRRRAIPEIRSRDANRRSLGERLAINSVVQGSAADLIKQAMVNLDRRIEAERLPLALLVQIHDELLLEAPAGEAEALAAIVSEEMAGAMSLRVPLAVDTGVGENWLEAK